MSTYAYSLDDPTVDRLQAAAVTAGHRLGLYQSDTTNLDFHAVPRWGEQSVLDKNWVGARGKGIKSALTVFAQDMTSKLLVYAQADIRRGEADVATAPDRVHFDRNHREPGNHLVPRRRFFALAASAAMAHGYGGWGTVEIGMVLPGAGRRDG